MNRTLTVYATDLAALRTRLLEANHRFVSADVPWRIVWSEESREHIVTDEDGKEIVTDVVDVTIIRTELEFGHWLYRAAVVVTDGGAVVYPAAGVDAADLPEVTDHSCGHCRTNRRRKYVYLMQHATTGEYVQIGKTCMADFCSATATMLRLAESGGVDVDDLDVSVRTSAPGVVRASARYRVRDIVRLALAISDFGRDYVPASAAEVSTGSSVRAALSVGGVDTSAVTSADVDAALADVAGVQGQYGDNLNTACSGETVPWEAVGLVASVAMVHRRAADQRNAPPPARGYHGVVGEKVSGITATVTVLRDVQTSFGMARLLVLRTDDDTELSWFGRVPYEVGGITLDTGQRVVVDRGRVRDHTTYGRDQRTELTRVALSRP